MQMEDFDDLKLSDSDDDEGAGERVRMIMEEIYKNQDKIKTEKDIEDMAERCTNMMSKMRSEVFSKKKEKKGRNSGGGDKASPPPSRSSVKESPRKDPTKGAASSLFPPSTKSSLKTQMDSKKKPQKPNFSDLFKDKVDKMKGPGKVDLKGQTKTDSTKVEEAMRRKPVLSGLNNKTPIKLNEEHFNDSLNRMKERGVRIKGKEGEPSVDRIIKTIAEESSSDENLSDIYASSNDSDDSYPEIQEEEKREAERLIKDLEQKKEQTLRPRDISELRKPYLSWLDKEKSSLSLGKYTKKDGASGKKKKDKELEKGLEIYSSESDPSEASIDTSEVESNPDDPFSQTPEGKDIMRKMKKIKVEPKRLTAEEKERKKRMKDLKTDGPGLRPSLDGISRSLMNTDPMEWCNLTRLQAESRNYKDWLGVKEDKDVESLWFKDICEASERARRSGTDKK